MSHEGFRERRLREALEFVPFGAFMVLEGDRQKELLTTSDFHAFFQQPCCKPVTLEGVSEYLVDFSWCNKDDEDYCIQSVANVFGEVSYEGFLRAVLSRDDRLRESILRAVS